MNIPTATGAPVNIPPELAAKMAATVISQAEDDKAGLVAATTTLPGPLMDVWALHPDIEEGPYKIRKFTIGDFKRLAALGHKLNSFTAVGEWLSDPDPFNDDAMILNWMMTHSIEQVKETITQGRDKILKLGEEEFGELDGLKLAMIMRAIAMQLAKCLDVKLEYKAAETPANGEVSSPPS
jgi:hypothetical protein